MNITKVIKQRENKLKEIKEKEIKEQKEINEENNNEEINKEENKEETDIIKNDDDNKSSYSKLSSNDYGVNLIDEVFEIHNVNNKYDIQNRMKLFKTRLLFTEDSEEKYNKLPKLFNLDEEDNKEKTEIKKEQTKEKVQIINKNDSEIFDIHIEWMPFNSSSEFNINEYKFCAKVHKILHICKQKSLLC